MMAQGARGQACSDTSNKAGRLVTHSQVLLGYLANMELPSLSKRRRHIGGMRLMHGINDPRPDVGERSDRHAMAFALSSFALIVVVGPALLQRTLPSELVQSIAQGFDAAQAA